MTLFGAGKQHPVCLRLRREYSRLQYNYKIESRNFAQVVTSVCSKSPSKYHQVYEGAESTSYTCRYCAFESRSFKQLVLSPCGKSPRKYRDAIVLLR